MSPQVFREYEIRDVVEEDFNDEFAIDLGPAYGTMLGRASNTQSALVLRLRG
jgi:phosphomannomutase